MVGSVFNRAGYALIRGLTEEDLCGRLRAAIQKLSGLADSDFAEKTFACPDGVSLHREFWPIIWNPRLLDAVRDVIGPLPRYTRHSDIHAHRTGGWHRDSACRDFQSGPDWDESREPYRVIRVAIYLQSFAESGSMLGVLPGSHRFEERLSPRESTYWQNRARLWPATRSTRHCRPLQSSARAGAGFRTSRRRPLRCGSRRSRATASSSTSGCTIALPLSMDRNTRFSFPIARKTNTAVTTCGIICTSGRI